MEDCGVSRMALVGPDPADKDTDWRHWRPHRHRFLHRSERLAGHFGVWSKRARGQKSSPRGP
eukprot:3994850-Alexandrium_andersonii.AAC.1